MKKTVLLFSCLALPLVSQAQVGRVLAPRLVEPFPKVMLSSKVYRAAALQMQENFSKAIVPTNVAKLRVEAFHASDALNKQIDNVYLDAISLTNELSNYLNAKIWYSLHDEEYAVQPAQVRDGLAFVSQVAAAIHQADLFLKPGDKPLEMAKTKLEYAYHLYQIYATGVIEPPVQNTLTDTYKQTAAHFNKHVFFLQEPVLPAPKNLLRGVLSKFSKSPLAFPKKLKVAVVADLSVLKDIETMAKEEGLQDWSLDRYKTPEEFLSTPQRLSYDLVLTDILIPGGGGIFLTRQLREQRFKGGIVAVTAYPEEEEIGVKLKADGMDGLITLSAFDDYFWLERPKTIAEKLRYYFYYRNNPTAVEFVRSEGPEGDK